MEDISDSDADYTHKQRVWKNCKKKKKKSLGEYHDLYIIVS